MGQEEVLKVLKKNKWMISGEIAAIIGIDRANINRALKTLLKNKEVERAVTNTRKGKRYLWKCL